MFAIPYAVSGFGFIVYCLTAIITVVIPALVLLFGIGQVISKWIKRLFNRLFKRKCIAGKRVFIVGKLCEDNRWGVRGVRSNMDDALLLCTDLNHFVGPIDIDKDPPEKACDWPGVRFPLREE